MNYKVVLGILLLAVLAVGGFFGASYFADTSGDTGLTSANFAPDVTSGIVGTTTSLTGQEFVRTLVNLQSLKLDDHLFSDPAFLSLQDFSVSLGDQPKGRPNPFAPIGQDAGVSQAALGNINNQGR